MFRFWSCLIAAGTLAACLIDAPCLGAEYDAALSRPGMRVEGSSRENGNPEINAFDADSSTFWMPPYVGGSWLVRTFEVPLDINKIEFNATGVTSYSVLVADSIDMNYEPIVTDEKVEANAVVKSIPAVKALSVKVIFNGSWPKVYSVRLYSDTSSQEQSNRRNQMRAKAPFVAVVMDNTWWSRPEREEIAAALSELKFPWARFSSSDIPALISRLDDFDVVMLGSLHTLAKENATALKLFMERGGTVIAFEANATGRYEWLSSLGADYAVLPGRYADEGSPSCSLNVVSKDTQLGLALKDDPNLIGNGTHFVLYGSAWQKIATSSLDYPVMLTANIGKGRLIVTTLRGDELSMDRLFSTLSGSTQAKPANKKQPASGSSSPLMVNGKPFFPIALYRAPVNLFSELKANGFNTVIHENQPKQDYLDDAGKAGLKVLPIIWNSVDYVKQYKDNPSILAWYMSDEPGGRNREDPREISNACSEIHKIDPNRKTLVICNYFGEHASAADIIAPDVYPITYCEQTTTSWPLWEIARKFKQLKASSAYGNKTLWVVPQAFGGFAPFAMPTAKQERAMVYGSICLGATGVLFYGWWTPEVPEWHITQEKELWPAVKQIARELNTLSPVLLSKANPGGVKAQNVSPDIIWTYRHYGSNDYIIACNWGASVANGCFLFSKTKTASAVDQFSKRSIKLSDGVLSISLQPLEAACFKVQH